MVQVIIYVAILIIFALVSLIKKAVEQARIEQQRSRQQGSQPQSTPWGQVKQFLDEAGVQTRSRPKPQQQRMQRPRRTAERAAPRPRRMQAPKPRVRQAPPRRAPAPPPAPRPQHQPLPQPAASLQPRHIEPQVEHIQSKIEKPAPVRSPEPARRKPSARAAFASVKDLRKMSRRQLRSAIMLREIIGPPRAARGSSSMSEFLP